MGNTSTATFYHKSWIAAVRSAQVALIGESIEATGYMACE
jgi:hypothetical protein